jgi:hypothetical protein
MTFDLFAAVALGFLLGVWIGVECTLSTLKRKGKL